VDLAILLDFAGIGGSLDFGGLSRSLSGKGSFTTVPFALALRNSALCYPQ